MPDDVSTLEERLGYLFRNRELLLSALTHPSFAYESHDKKADNQRLEFLGDAVLQLVVSETLYTQKSEAAEGDMTRMRANLVCEPTLTRIAHTLDLGAFLRLGHGEQMTGGRDNPSNLSDALEAVFGAIYLDGGLGAVDAVISKLFSPYVELALGGRLHYDHKSLLYEWAQSDKGRDVEFKLLDMTGPEHDRQFTVGLFVEGKLINNGTGKTKKAAEQDASRRFFEDVRKD